MAELEEIKALGFPDVRAFQAYYGLTVDGIIGPQTRGALAQVRWLHALLPIALRLEREAGPPAAARLTQATLEAGVAGASALARAGNNLFGIKVSADWSGAWGEYWTSEWDRATKQYIRVRARFRHYPSVEACLEDHTRLLLQPRYRPALAYRDSPAGYLRAIWRAGYATSPTYLDTAVAIMAKWHIEALVRDAVAGDVAARAADYRQRLVRIRELVVGVD